MASVWYLGRADSRTITDTQWTAAGAPGATVTWNKTNGYSLDRAQFTAQQLAVLDGAGEFNTNAADGPRPGGSVGPADAPALRYTDLTGMGIDPKQLRRRFQAWQPGAANSYTGPVLSGDDLPAFTPGVALDAAYSVQYTTLAAGVKYLPNAVSCFGKMSIASNTWAARTSNPGTATVSTYRFMTDADDVMFMTYAASLVIDIYVNGKPFGNNPVTPGVTTGLSPFGMQRLLFPSAKPRLIELRMIGGLSGIYLKPMFSVWKPAVDPRPKIAVVGDSFVAPTVMSDTAAGAASELYSNGIYQRLPMLLGTPSLVTDGIGGTGYLAPSGANAPYTLEARKQWLQDVNPDVAIIHGGGANDLYNAANWTNQQIVDAIVPYFKDLRNRLPNAKLVFVEGFAPPLAGFSENNPDYIAIRQMAQAALGDVGVYYIDVATSDPWITGSPNGWVTANAGAGNSNIYTGSDAVHLTVRGNLYVRQRMLPKIAKVLADDGTLLNQLI